MAVRERLGRHEQRFSSLGASRLKGARKLGGLPHREVLKGKSQGFRRHLHPAERKCHTRVVCAPKDGEPREVRNGFLQQLDPLAVQVCVEEAQPGDIGPGPGQARHGAAPDGVAHVYHDDRDRRGRCLGRQGGGRTAGHDHRDLEAHKVGGKLGETLGPALCPPVLDDHVLSLDIPGVAEPSAEGVEEGVGLSRRSE